jgi:DNA primase
VTKAVAAGATLFGLHVLRPGATALLTESPLDAVLAYGYGYHAVAAYGSYVTNHRLELIRGRTNRLIVGLDNDRARRDAHRLLCDRTVSFDKLWVLNYSHCADCKDVGDLTHDQLEIAIETSVPAT